MRLKTSFELAWNILIHSKLRSWLTIIGIVIGIAAVVSIVSISQGAQQTLQSRLGQLGADTLTVTPGMSRARGTEGGFVFGGGGGATATSKTAKNLTSKDVLVLKNINNVLYAMGSVSGRETMAYSGKSATVSITGVDPTIWKDITAEKIASGRLLVQGDSSSVVVGNNIVTSVFKDGIPLNSQITVGGKSFKVVGILQDGSGIYMPINDAKIVLDSVGVDSFNSISVKIKDVSLANDTVNLITKKLMLSRGILNSKDQDFSVMNPAAIQQTMQQTMQAMTLFLTAIAAISLLVGAVGITNTMFTSVVEKTREIGIMKAIGTKNKDILLIFLFNSGLIGLVGGIGGIILGIFGSGLVSMLGSGSSGNGLGRMFSNTAITPGLLIFALLFSLILGMVAGAIPAYRASKLKPVDALRYE